MGLLFGILLPLLCIVSFVGFVWLVCIAFRTSTPWGVGVLLLSPISALIFAIKHWQESKKPFLIYAGSFMAACVLLVGMGGFAMMSMANAVQVAIEEAPVEFVVDGFEEMEAPEDLGQTPPVFHDVTAERQETGEAPRITLIALDPITDDGPEETATFDEDAPAVTPAMNVRSWQGPAIGRASVW